MLRYLLLLFHGGVYSDTDTILLKPPHQWGQSPTLWNPSSWLPESTLAQLQPGVSVDSILGPPSLIIGIEADVGGRPDWNDWWTRPIQFVQWTTGSAPGHPVMLMSLYRILRGTAHVVEWSHARKEEMDQLKDLEEEARVGEMERRTVLNEPGDGGPLGVMEWTGPGVFTDAVMR